MRDYRAGTWGFHVAIGWYASVAPRALVMAIPNAALTFIVSFIINQEILEEPGKQNETTIRSCQAILGAFNGVMLFVLYNRSNTAYDRWWEGGTLLQKTRGEWFNAFSSILAFTSVKSDMQDQVDSYCHLMARLMSLLMCCGLQQVSPNRNRAFKILDCTGIDEESLRFLAEAPDKVEVILQWIQRSMVLHVQTGVLPVAPPILSRAFQELSRGIVNLQNARKIADFPFPFPLAQVSMILLLTHWAITPVALAYAFSPVWGTLVSLVTMFVMWCIHFNALDLEFPFGTRDNDLPMETMLADWNKSMCTLLMKRATTPPTFSFQPDLHSKLKLAMSDGTCIPQADKQFLQQFGVGKSTVGGFAVPEPLTCPSAIITKDCPGPIPLTQNSLEQSCTPVRIVKTHHKAINKEPEPGQCHRVSKGAVGGLPDHEISAATKERKAKKHPGPGGDPSSSSSSTCPKKYGATTSSPPADVCLQATPRLPIAPQELAQSAEPPRDTSESLAVKLSQAARSMICVSSGPSCGSSCAPVPSRTYNQPGKD